MFWFSGIRGCHGLKKVLNLQPQFTSGKAIVIIWPIIVCRYLYDPHPSLCLSTSTGSYFKLVKLNRFHLMLINWFCSIQRLKWQGSCWENFPAEVLLNFMVLSLRAILAPWCELITVHKCLLVLHSDFGPLGFIFLAESPL